ncbi:MULTISPECIES: MFS transporter [Citricoccus]|uniref:MFS transporter n=1 Tax=Citricoccus TaxID=169133 RepID=UPI000255EE1C|nr:MFS transporter [Citricoccus sp. CH26A]
MAINLRTAVTAVSAIVTQISADVALSDVALGTIGMLPPLMLAAGGLVGPVLTRWISLETGLVISLVVMVAGHLMRAGADTFPVLLVSSIVAMLGMGVGNVLLPALVKKYFPDRIAVMTSIYAMLFSVSTAIPGAVSPMVADAAGWRTALLLWGVVAAVAVPPWLALLLRSRRVSSTEEAGNDAVVGGPTRAGLWRSRTAWGLLLMYGLSSLNGYAMLAWLPEILRDTAGVTAVDAGILLSGYAVTAGPLALIVPAIALRMSNPGVLSYVGAVTFIAGYLGLMLCPEFLTPLWVLTAALGTGLFPVMLALINARTRTPAMTASLSGFVQGQGALVSVAGPPVVGILRDWTGSWTAPFVFLIVTAAGIALSGILLRSPRLVDDELAELTGRDERRRAMSVSAGQSR